MRTLSQTVCLACQTLVSAVAAIDHLLKEMKDGCRYNVQAKRLVGKARAATPSTRTPYRILHGLLYHVADGKHRVFVPHYKHLRRREWSTLRGDSRGGAQPLATREGGGGCRAIIRA